MQTINKSMAGIVKALDKSLASNNLEQVANTMDQFEKQFENLDIQSEFVESAMNAQASLSTPEEDVNMLVQQVCLLPLGCITPCYAFFPLPHKSPCVASQTAAREIRPRLK